MNLENEKQNNVSADSSYGGSTYRLSYDSLVKEKKKKSMSSRTRSAIAVITIVVLFFAFAMLVLGYYDDAVKKLYGSNETTVDNVNEVDYSTSVNIVVD